MVESRRADSPILLAKLKQPDVAASVVVRPRLLKLLNSGLENEFTLVVAPAGFGKTALIASWLESLAQDEATAAWLSLDAEDSDLGTFLRYVIAALRRIFPDACAETLSLLNGYPQPSVDRLAATLSNEIERLPSRCILVLDDFHTLHSQAIPDLLKVWLRHWPSPLHLVVISRIQPPLPLADLRLKGRVMEIRSRDLRFTLAESSVYLDSALAGRLDERMRALLQQRMEGWIAGLKLATLFLMRHADTKTLPLELLGDDHHVAEYLLDQVWQQQSAAMQRFLLAISIPDRFCAALGAALMEGHGAAVDAQACMDELEAADLFVTALDHRREWYRFHDLFRDFLQRRAAQLLEEGEIKALHLRAAGWHAQQGLPDQALQHAIRADDFVLAAQVMQQELADVLNREDRLTLERWLRLLPETDIQQNPQLLVMRAWQNIFRWDFAHTARIVSRIKALVEHGEVPPDPEAARLLRGQLAVFEAQVAHHANRSARGVACCQEALSLLPAQWRYTRGVAMSYLGLCMQAAGQSEKAEARLVAEYQAASEKSDSYALHILLALGINAIKAGQLGRAERVAQVIGQKAAERQLAFMQSWSHTSLGIIYYLWNELALAAQHFAAVMELRFATLSTIVRKAMTGLALTYLAQGKGDAAQRTLEQLSLLDVELDGREAVETAAMRARIMHMQGQQEIAERWVDQFTTPPPDRPLYPSTEEPYTTRVRILIARGRPQDIEAALCLLAQLNEIAERTFNTRTKVELLALRALAKAASGEAEAAREALVASVQLAQEGRIVRTFVDLGPPMRELLYQIAAQRSVARTVARILDAFATVPDRPPAADYPLTPRELEVLDLLAQRLTAKEVARQLVISPYTVKRHRANIYQKLNVSRLRDALVVARTLGLLNGR